MEIELDLLEGMSGRKTVDGYEFDRIATVRGITGSGHSKIYAAMNVAGMPNIGDPHPAIAYCLLREIIPIEVTQTKVKFRLSYKTTTPNASCFADDSIRGGASVMQVSTNQDINDVDLMTQYTYPADYKDSNLCNKTETQGQRVTVLRPQTTWSKQKLRSYNPQNEADYYVGRINSSSWRGSSAKSWLCTAIEFYSEDGGKHYNVTYTFQKDFKEGNDWKCEYSFVRDDGKPPPVLDTLNHKYAEEYKTANFNNLNL